MAEVKASEALLQSLQGSGSKVHVAVLLVTLGRLDEARVTLLEGESTDAFEEAVRLAYIGIFVVASATSEGRAVEASSWFDEALPKLYERALCCRPWGVFGLLRLLGDMSDMLQRQAHSRTMELDDVTLKLRALLNDRGAACAIETLDQLRATRPLQVAALSAAKALKAAWFRLKALSGEPEMNTGVLVLSDGTPCIVYDRVIPYVRNIEVGSADFRVTLVSVDPQTGVVQRNVLPYPLSDAMVARFRKFEIIGIGRVTAEQKVDDLHMIPVVFQDSRHRV